MTNNQKLFQDFAAAETHRNASLQLQYDFDKPLAPLTYFKIGGPAEIFLKAEKNDIKKIIKFSQSKNIPLTILGGASNVVISDKGITGIVLQIADSSFKIIDSSRDASQCVSTDKQCVSTATTIKAGAGLRTAFLVKKSMDEGLTGLEYFLGVPGTVGGAIYNNAHYLEDLISEHIVEVEVMNKDGQIFALSRDECDFAYDHSRFQSSQEIILSATFRLKKGDQESSQAKLRHAVTYRARTQPLNLPSSGCIFQNVKNTEKLRKRFPQFAKREHIPAGFLIDQAGLKRSKQGDIEVSEKHAAFLVNQGHGRAADVIALIKNIKNTVKTKFAVELKEEIFYLGEL